MKKKRVTKIPAPNMLGDTPIYFVPNGHFVIKTERKTIKEVLEETDASKDN